MLNRVSTPCIVHQCLKKHTYTCTQITRKLSQERQEEKELKGYTSDKIVEYFG